MDVSGYKRKFKLLFDRLLEPTFEISAYHSENLFKYLDGSRGHCELFSSRVKHVVYLLNTTTLNWDNRQIIIELYVRRRKSDIYLVQL